jgi:hypothetical protein
MGDISKGVANTLYPPPPQKKKVYKKYLRKHLGRLSEISLSISESF